MKNSLSTIISVFFLVSNAEAASTCTSAYFEAVYLNNANTFAGLAVPRFGMCDPESGIEAYGVARIGVDSRTFLDRGDAIYNDNYLFLGAGADYTKLFPGVRLTAQTGYSFDLNSKIHRAGFDFRTGFATYHEKRWTDDFRNEIYTEGFYVRRYFNFMFSAQVRSFYALWRSENDPYRGFELGPYANLMASHDVADYQYNRFLEAHYGARIRYQAPLTLALQAYGVAGKRTDGSDPRQGYADFRVLVTGYFEY